MAHICKCYYCGASFDRDKEENVVQVNARRYAHGECHEKHLALLSKEEQSLLELEDHIKYLFQTNTIAPFVQRQIATFHDVNHYSYSGMLKTLKYFQEVKKGTLKSSGGIGIIPHIYDEANNYYYTIWMANKINEEQHAELIEKVKNPPKRQVVIPIPRRKNRCRKLFAWVDEKE